MVLRRDKSCHWGFLMMEKLLGYCLIEWKAKHSMKDFQLTYLLLGLGKVLETDLRKAVETDLEMKQMKVSC